MRSRWSPAGTQTRRRMARCTPQSAGRALTQTYRRGTESRARQYRTSLRDKTTCATRADGVQELKNVNAQRNDCALTYNQQNAHAWLTNNAANHSCNQNKKSDMRTCAAQLCSAPRAPIVAAADAVLPGGHRSRRTRARGAVHGHIPARQRGRGEGTCGTVEPRAARARCRDGRAPAAEISSTAIRARRSNGRGTAKCPRRTRA